MTWCIVHIEAFSMWKNYLFFLGANVSPACMLLQYIPCQLSADGIGICWCMQLDSLHILLHI